MDDNVAGIPGYHVSKDGRVFSRRRYGSSVRLGSEWKERKLSTGDLGRKEFTARNADGKVFLLRVHRLVLLAYVGPCPEGMECRHLDGNPSNNCVENLAWGTPLQNHEDKRLHGTNPMGERSPSAKLSNEKVVEILLLRDAGESYSRLGKRFGVDGSTIYKICKGKRWAHIRR